jgi:hypothetical protein
MRPATRKRVIDRADCDVGGEQDAQRPSLSRAGPSTSAGEGEPRSSYGTVPGAEFPTFIYVSVVAAFGWVMLASWLAFARGADAHLALGMAVVLAIVFFALPIIIHRVAAGFSRSEPQAARDFLTAPVETETGPLSGASAWLQVLIIPLSLALAATLIGGASVLVR